MSLANKWMRKKIPSFCNLAKLVTKFAGATVSKSPNFMGANKQFSNFLGANSSFESTFTKN